MTCTETHAEVVVLGAGLTGSCVALELARRGIAVLLLERDERPMNRASLRNEGKIHLGLIYANDPTRQTAVTQLRGALQFRRLLARWLGDGVARIGVSTPFHYHVAHDSVLTPEELELHYQSLQQTYDTLCAEDPDCDYLGARPGRLAHRLPRAVWHPACDAARSAAVFETAERAIDPADLAREVERALKTEPRITLRTGHAVDSVQATDGAWLAEGHGDATAWRVRAKTVVNALWENRLRVDAQVGLPVRGDWLHRLKFRVIADLPAPMRGAPSATIVLGRYGDLVVRPDGTAYLSWYPAGLRGWTHDLAPPASWNGPCRGELDDTLRAEVARQIIDGLADWYPGLRACRPKLVDAGAIVATGRTDVDDRASGLHDRSQVGVTSAGSYHSIEPGKLTTAPLFAYEAAERIVAQVEART